VITRQGNSWVALGQRFTFTDMEQHWAPKRQRAPCGNGLAKLRIGRVTQSATPPVHSAPSQVQTVPTPQSVESFGYEATPIGKSIVIKGEVSGSENVYVAGELEGSVELIDGSLTVRPDGHIRANLRARSVP
jgi:hypothetical protein